MAITKGTPTVNNGTGTTSYTLVINSGVLADDILVLATVNRDATAAPTVTDNDTGGNTWTNITSQNANTNGSVHIFAKRATSATASKTITCSGNTGSCTGVVMPYRGASKAAIASCFGTPVKESNASGDEAQAGITTTRAGSMVLSAVGVTSNDTLNVSNRTATDPSSMTEDGEGTSSGGSDCSCSLASATRSAAGATGTISWSMTNGTTGSIAIELLPAWDALTASGDAYSLTGQSATLKFGHLVVAAAAAFALTGQSATFTKGIAFPADSGSYALAGSNAALTTTRLLTAAATAYTLSGQAATLKRGYPLSANAGAYSLSGQGATLTYTPGSGITMTAESGAFALSGQAATLKYGHDLIADTAAYSFTGQTATFHRNYVLSAEGGTFAWTGQIATLGYSGGANEIIGIVGVHNCIMTGPKIGYGRRRHS